MRIYNGRNMYGVQNPPKCMTIRRDAKKYPFNERGDAAFEKYAVKFAAEEEIKRKGIPIIDNKQTYEEYSTEALLNRYAAGNLSRNTYERYLEFQKRIIPIIGSKRMNDIDANDIERVQTQLLSCNSIEKKAQAKSRLDKVIKEGLLQYAAYDELKATVQKKHHSNADGKIPLSVLARAAGVATSTVRKALDGESIEQTSAAKIAKALGYDASQLFEIKDEFKQLSKKTVLEHINVISSVFTKAKKSKIVLFNPVDFIEKVEPEKPNQIFYTPEVINEILEALDAETIYWKVMGTILIYTGIRRGELLGLSWDDVDFEANTISIHNKILSSNGKMYFKAGTKSNSSERTLLVIPYIIDLLKQYREWRSEHGDNDI